MRLAQVRKDLEQLLAPRQEPGFFQRLWGLTQEPVELQSKALSALLKQATPTPGQSVQRGPGLAIDFDAACHELKANVAALRALSESREHPPFAYVTWLWRVTQALEKLEEDGWLEPVPVAPRPTRSRPQSSIVTPDPYSRLPFATAPLLAPLPSGPQLRGLALQPLLDVANRETRQLGRRRRLLEAARRVLLESAASIEMPPSAVEARVVAITEQIREINQWQATGVDPDVAVSHRNSSSRQPPRFGRRHVAFGRARRAGAALRASGVGPALERPAFQAQREPRSRVTPTDPRGVVRAHVR